MRRASFILLLVANLAFPSAAVAADVDLFSARSLSLSGDVRLVAGNGEESWLDGGFGKLRSSGDASGGLRITPELGSLDLVWQPSAGFAWSATVVGTLQGGERTEVGISEAFVSYKPMRGRRLGFSARAGVMWPPISLEHGGADWHVLDTVTPSAINSWVGEEVRPLAAEGSVTTTLGEHQISGTAAILVANDTAGTLLAFRGWALHDRRTLMFNRQPLPPLPATLQDLQPRYTHPLLDVDKGFARRPGYYAKLAWQGPQNVRVELFRYDNRADPEAADHNLEWGWRTRFNQVAIDSKVGANFELKAQAMSGSTLMGFPEQGRIWVDTPFRSAFLLLTQQFEFAKAAARLEAFDLRQEGSLLTDEAEEKGWSATMAVSRPINPSLTALIELLHVSSRRDQRREIGLSPRQQQTQIQGAMRFRW